MASPFHLKGTGAGSSRAQSQMCSCAMEVV